MSEHKSALKFHSEDNGNCRVYFKRGRALYCYQEEMRGKFVAYRCSNDGEPSYTVTLMENPQCPGETTTGQSLNAWSLKRQGGAL